MRVAVVGGTVTVGNLVVKELARRVHYVVVVAASRTARSGPRRSSTTSERSCPRARRWIWRRRWSAAAEPVPRCSSSGRSGCAVAYSGFPGTPLCVAEDDSRAVRERRELSVR